MAKVRNSGTFPPYEGKIREWGLRFLRKNRWRIAAMCDDDDIKQAAFFIYWRIRCYHPHLRKETEVLRLYRTALWRHLMSQASDCYPNPYNVGQEERCFSLTASDGSDLTSSIVDAVYNPMITELEDCLDLVKKLPRELQDAFSILVRESMGFDIIKLRKRTNRHGKITCGPLNMALARMTGVKEKRDFIGEIGKILAVAE